MVFVKKNLVSDTVNSVLKLGCMKIYVTGISGSGKSAIAKELKRRDIFAFDIEEIEGICCWIDKKTQEKADDYSPTMTWLKDHDWVCNVEKLHKILENNQGLLIATGITGNQDEYLHLFDKIFLLQSPDKILAQRMEVRHINPGENAFGKYGEEREFALKGRIEFEKKMIEKGAVGVDSSKDIAEVASKILSEIKV